MCFLSLRSISLSTAREMLSSHPHPLYSSFHSLLLEFQLFCARSNRLASSYLASLFLTFSRNAQQLILESVAQIAISSARKENVSISQVGDLLCLFSFQLSGFSPTPYLHLLPRPYILFRHSSGASISRPQILVIPFFPLFRSYSIVSYCILPSAPLYRTCTTVSHYVFSLFCHLFNSSNISLFTQLSLLSLGQNQLLSCCQFKFVLDQVFNTY